MTWAIEKQQKIGVLTSLAGASRLADEDRAGIRAAIADYRAGMLTDKMFDCWIDLLRYHAAVDPKKEAVRA
jgi:hypothetical protein